MRKQPDRNEPADRQTGGAAPTPPNTTSFKERIGALKNILPFIAMVWQTGPGLTAALLLLRSTRALLPIATLYVGKLIVDDVVRLVQMPGRPEALSQWLHSGLLNGLIILLTIEFALAIFADVLG